MKITKNYFGKFYINQLIRSFDYILLFIIFIYLATYLELLSP